MAKVDPNAHGSARPKLTVDDLEEDVALLKIASYEEAEIDDTEAPDGKRMIAMLFFEETGDKAMYLNKTQLEYLIEGLDSDDSDDWAGHVIPVEKRSGSYRGRKYEKVHVCDPDEWEDYMEKPKKKKRAKAKRSR
jgi:hypothetical protein